MKQTITAIILTYNEEKHIARCIKSLQSFANQIIVIDSISSDKTIEIAESLGAIIYQNPFVNQAVQFNWALKNCDIKSEWVFRIDADEYVDNRNDIDLLEFVSNLSEHTTGLIIRRKIVFMGQPLLNGGWYPKLNLRLFRNGFGECENRWMDEHIVLSHGNVEYIQLDIVDENLNNLSWWINKHNGYSSREAIDYFLKKDQECTDVKANFFGTEAEKKRWLKVKYNLIPLFVRPFINFIYRYIFKLGFLDGKSGLVWHILQGFWYRFLVDAKIYELRREFHNDEKAIVAHIKKKYQIS